MVKCVGLTFRRPILCVYGGQTVGAQHEQRGQGGHRPSRSKWDNDSWDCAGGGAHHINICGMVEMETCLCLRSFHHSVKDDSTDFS